MKAAISKHGFFSGLFLRHYSKSKMPLSNYSNNAFSQPYQKKVLYFMIACVVCAGFWALLLQTLFF